MLASAPSRSFAKIAKDLSTNSITIDPSKCVGCGVCVKTCKTVAGQGVLALVDVNGKKRIGTANGKPLQESTCVKCGQCTLVCKPSALSEKDQISEVEKVLNNPNGKVAVCQTAPAIRINLSDALGLPAGTISTGKMVSALRKLGFKYVFDTNYSADLTIMEEATEFVSRLTKGTGPLPMFTSCCPAWVNYVEQSDPDLIPNLSTCRSPLGMLSSITHFDFAKRKGIEGKVFNVAIMPCTAKKDEIERPQFSTKGFKETDYVITTRELMRMIKKHKIDFKNLPDSEFDVPFSEASGAGAIFCGSGGVMEAAVRTAYNIVTGKELPGTDLVAVRGHKDGIKVASVDIEGTKVGVAVAQGIANAMKLIKMIKDKDPKVADVKFVEVMACPGGCVCGGGSTKAKTKKATDARVDAVYKIDTQSKVRCSHQNQQLKELYDRLLEKPNSHLAHELLHTHYTNKKK
ncbi:iron hydrogenase [Histomonas meleagridis]|uniref:iron hydrogenase n=1 Tax=Histomonas meleagridis TaxID=135588 RepID=UPI00355A8712|nr:iron hydrogenase [Histomonas meleagridis]KAH0802485.1 iron hydrogenase [Histomonas meleagridis]